MQVNVPQHTCDMALLDSLFSQPFCKDVGHSLRRESDTEREFRVVSRHSGDVLLVKTILI